MSSLRLISPWSGYTCTLLFWLVAQSVFSQSFTDCGTDDYTRQRMVTDSMYRQFVLNARAIQTIDKAANDALLTIPVLFVVYHLGEPTGTGSNIAESALQAQVELMNREFAASSSLYADGGTDSRIQFVMARRGPDCLPLNGVVRIDGRSVPGYQVAGVDYKDIDIQQKLRNLAGPALNEMAQQAVIVRVFWRVTGAGGWAGFGGEITTSAPYISSSGPYNDLMAHEMGHVLFLHHTFQGGDDNVNCPPNANPFTQGDEVADTDPHLKDRPLLVCTTESEATINSCSGRAFGRIGRNIMSYGCSKYIFTPGQIARMRGYLAGSLNRFVNSPYAFPPTTAEALVPVACQPTSALSSTVTNYQVEGIARVRIGTMDSQTNFYGFQPLLYQDMSCNQQATLRAGQSYTITIDAPFNNLYRRVYVDWNNDGSFDEATERAFSTQIGDETGTVTIPANAPTGQTLRMRVVVCDGETAPTACFVPVQGAVQDFGIRVEPANSQARIRVEQLNSLSYCSGQSLLIPYTLTGGGNLSTVSVRAELSDAGGSFAAPLLLTIGLGGLLTVELPGSLPTGTAYRIRLSTAAPDIDPDQTPPLNIRQTPTATLKGPVPATSVSGRPVALTLSFTGDGPWVVNTQVTPAQNDYNLPGQYYSLTFTSPTAVVTGSPTANVAYRLLALTSGCLSGSMGNSVSVTINCAPPDDLIETDLTSTSAYLIWENLGYRAYYLQWKPANATNWNTAPSQFYPGFYLNNLTLGSAYEWRVATLCPNGTTSAYSAPRSFTLTCPVPDGLYEQIATSTATLGWGWAGASSYEVRWRLQGATDWTIVPNLSASSYLLSNLTSGQVYEWQVRGLCGAGGSSAFSAIRTFTTACSPPFSGYASSVGSTTARVTWWSVSGEQYVVRWRLPNASVWTLSELVTVSSLLLMGLPSGQTIEWSVQTNCSNGSQSAFMPTQFFYTNCILPTLIVSDIKAQSVRVSWSAPTITAMYIGWRKAGATGWFQAYSSGSATTQYTILDLERNTAYEIRLGPVGSNGYFCAYTAPVSFTTASCAPPGLLTLTGPQTALSGIPITLVASLSGAAPWSFTLNNGQEFTNVQTSPFSFTTSLTNSNYYYLDWYVGLAALANACGSIDPYSRSISVQVLLDCGRPPTNLRLIGRGTTTASVAWDLPPNVYSATLQWRQAGMSTWTTIPAVYTAYNFNGLTYGQAYEWRIQSVCSQGQPITPSAVQSFTLTCPEPYLLAETLNMSVAQLTWAYQWSSSAPVTYNLRWRFVGNTTWNTQNNLNAISFTVAGLSENGVYEWQVQTNCPGGGTTSFTPVRQFTASCGMPANPYASVVTANAATIRWSTQSGQSYKLRYRPITPEVWLNNTTYTGSVGSLSGLTGNTGYYIQLQAICANGQRSPFSESGYFSTPCQTATATLSGNVIIMPGQTTSLLVTLLGSPPFALTLNTGQSFNGISGSPYVVGVSPANTTSYSLVRVSNTCGTGLVAGSPVTVTVSVQSCSIMQTVSAGNWTDPVVWSCNRIPVSTDPVLIRHSVTLPSLMLHYAQRIRYDSGGRLVFLIGARLQLSQ